MDRLQQKYSLFIKLGALFGPLHRLVEHPDQYNDQESARVIARYCAEWPQLNREMTKFCAGEPGHLYSIQQSLFQIALHTLMLELQGGKALKDVLPKTVTKAQAAIDAIPVAPPSAILEAGSPFTAYCRLRELCEIDATASLTWLDPYFDASIFHRYLSAVRPKTAIALITSEPRSNSNRRDRERWDAFLDISRLFAQERSPATYRLVIQPSLHDRWLVLDEKRIYNLGGSAKDAAVKDNFTISTLDPTPANLNTIAQHLTSGTELFGPTTTVHA